MAFSAHLKWFGAPVLCALVVAAPALGAAHCRGDVDGVVIDGRVSVNVFDFSQLAASFGSPVPPGTGPDLDGNGFVNVFDFSILAGSFGCEAAVESPPRRGAMCEHGDVRFPYVLGTLTRNDDPNGGCGDHPCPDWSVEDNPDPVLAGSSFEYAEHWSDPDEACGDSIMYSGEDCNANGMDDTIDLYCSVAVGTNAVPSVVASTRLHSGELVARACDLAIRGRGIPFAWCRTYRSRLGPNTAMGNGWDYSYDIFVEAAGADLDLHDGRGRIDRYENQAPGLWTDEEFFRTLETGVDGGYTLTFPHGGTWSFLPLDGSSSEGRISAITDRNGNAITFQYDPAGRLALISDTLDDPANPRQITVLYNADNRIDSIIDFTGRVVHYEYYDGVEPGGSLGDLKSVTSPPITGTPNGNDFPLGKTTTYTYTTGFDNDRLNHNLLTVTDPKGQTPFAAEYGATIAPADLIFDRVTRLTVGDPGDVIDLVYTELTPDPLNNLAVIKTTVNDRVGNVREYLYDDNARLVVARAHTGRADPDQPTDLDGGLNLPGAPLRASDPPFFETRWEWNADSLCTRVLRPNGNETDFQYDELNPDRRAEGNLLVRTRLPGPLGGDQPQIVDQWQYDPLVNFDHNLVTRHTDPRGHNTDFLYDPQGNLIHITHRIPSIVDDFTYNAFGQLASHTGPDNGAGHRRVDTFTYYTPLDGCMNGQLHETTIDDGGFDLTTTYEYDCLDRLTRCVDPRGHDALYEYNDLDECVRIQSREVTTVNPVRTERLFWYDANDNLVRSDVSNQDDQGALDPANTHFTTIYEYDVLNRPTRMCAEKGAQQLGNTEVTCADVDPSEFVPTGWEYDANGNPTRVRFGAEVSDPDNAAGCGASRLYDERDLLFECTRGAGTPEQSTTRYDYDGNRNLVAAHQGTEADTAPAYPGDAARLSSFEYDGYDRLTQSTDPMGNLCARGYDAAGNCGPVEVFGEPNDVPGSAGNIRLAERTCDYDDMDRPTECRVEHFDPATQLPIGDGQSTMSWTYNGCSQLLTCTDDNSHTTTYTYDSANRLETVTDARGNSAAYDYDDSSNVTQTTETDKSDLGNPDEIFVTTYAYDALDRLTRVIDPASNQTDLLYDSRSNRARTIDPRANVTAYAYDGLDRPLTVGRILTDTGDGGGLPIGAATTSYAYDEYNRIVQITDPNAHTTSRAYDPLNRPVVTTSADGTQRLGAYDTHDNLISALDPNQTLVDATYDANDRRTQRVILVGPGVSNDTTLESYAYDGLDRLVSAQDDDSSVLFAYDSLSDCTAETLTIGAGPDHVTARTFDGVGNELSCTYPGGRQIAYAYDALDRVNQVLDGGLPHVSLFRVGIGTGIDIYGLLSDKSTRVPRPCPPRPCHRIERITRANGTQTDFSYDGIANAPDDFGVKRIVGVQHALTLGLTFDQRAYAWDPAGSKSTNDVLAGPPPLQTSYAYDSLNRLTRTTEVDPDTLATRRDTGYVLDAAGNRSSEAGSFASGTYVLDPTLPNPADAQVNQYTQTPVRSFTHDDNGNRTGTTHANTGDQVAYIYDYRDRLVEAVNLNSGDTTQFAYDALGRRIRKTGPAGETRYYYDGARVIEERDGADLPVATFTADVAGGDRPVDLPWSMRRAGQDYYYHTDDLGSTIALTDSLGNVVERYAYDDYGRVLITVAAQAPNEDQGGFVSDVDESVSGASEEIAENVELDTRPVVAIRWWGGYVPGPELADRFNIRIYADAGGIPGPLLYEELNVTQAGRAPTGLLIGPPENVYTYELSPPYFVPDTPGQYWISIQNDTSDVPGVAWVWTGSSGGDGFSAHSTADGPFTLAPNDLALEVYTDQSSVGNPYLFHGMRYDQETGLYVGGSNAYDPATGRLLDSNQQTVRTINFFSISGDNPTSGASFMVIGDDAASGPTRGITGCISPAAPSPLPIPYPNVCTTDPTGPTWIPLFGEKKDDRLPGPTVDDWHISVPAPSCRDGIPIIEWTFEKGWPCAHVDCPGHADYFRNVEGLDSETEIVEFSGGPIDGVRYGDWGDFSRHSTSSSLGMCSATITDFDITPFSSAFAHVDCPGHADYIKNMTVGR